MEEGSESASGSGTEVELVLGQVVAGWLGLVKEMSLGEGWRFGFEPLLGFQPCFALRMK